MRNLLVASGTCDAFAVGDDALGAGRAEQRDEVLVLLGLDVGRRSDLLVLRLRGLALELDLVFRRRRLLLARGLVVRLGCRLVLVGRLGGALRLARAVLVAERRAVIVLLRGFAPMSLRV